MKKQNRKRANELSDKELAQIFANLDLSSLEDAEEEAEELDTSDFDELGAVLGSILATET